MAIEKKIEVVTSVAQVDVEVASHESKRSHEEKDVEAESQISSVETLQGRRFEQRSRKGFGKPRSNLLSRLWHAIRWREDDSARLTKDKKNSWYRLVVTVLAVLAVFGVIAAVVYISFVRTLLSHLAPLSKHNGLETIVKSWKEPDANGAFKYEWRDDFSRDIVAKNCHSHNDYWRSVPLYAALAAGCTSIEADVWLTEENELLVAHKLGETKQYRTLRSLYLDPIATIFEKRNVSTASDSDKEIGMFDSDASVSTVLLIDVKTDGHKIWPVLQAQLQPLRDRNWLTYYDGETIHQGPLTIVGSGQTPFELIQRNTTERFIFYDAPLVSISQPQFDSTNSYYASANFKALMPLIWLGKFTSKQEQAIKGQVQAAELKGLKSRYYDTPAWPIGLRDAVWMKLMDYGVSMLNVDDLISATRWNWGFCVVAGIALCGNS